MTRYSSRYRIAAPFGLVLAFIFFAAFATPADAATFSIANNSGLVFGKFVAGTGGTVIISTSGARSATGGPSGVTLVNSTNQPAQFTVRCIEDTGLDTCNLLSTFSISTVADTTLASGVYSMSLTGITVYSVNNNSNSTGQLSGGGTDSLKVGGTLTVGGNQPPGSYSGSFSVTVAYQ